ncbi:MAG: degP1 [Acidobacteriaceae bacterium]|nr:degP1 [Acidobacteriaceae bacterium]
MHLKTGIGLLMAIAIVVFGLHLEISAEDLAPLSLSDLEHALKGGVTSVRVAELVRQYGVDFQMTPDAERLLRAVGATDDLITTISASQRTAPRKEERVIGASSEPGSGKAVAQLGMAWKDTTITEIAESLPAQKAGIRIGDTILAIDSKPVKSSSELFDTIRQLKIGQTVNVVLLRGGHVEQVRATPVGRLIETQKVESKNDPECKLKPGTETKFVQSMVRLEKRSKGAQSTGIASGIVTESNRIMTTLVAIEGLQRLIVQNNGVSREYKRYKSKRYYGEQVFLYELKNLQPLGAPVVFTALTPNQGDCLFALAPTEAGTLRVASGRLQMIPPPEEVTPGLIRKTYYRIDSDNSVGEGALVIDREGNAIAVVRSELDSVEMEKESGYHLEGPRFSLLLTLSKDLGEAALVEWYAE